jgi:SAM-dependent methyltransferase
VWRGHGLEIGGPSGVFRPHGVLPLYALAERVDNLNFAAQTAWGAAPGEVTASPLHTGRRPGQQVIAEGADLGPFACAAFDFLLASHVIEHLANPLGALRAWGRVLRPGGVLVLLLPHRQATFDHRRPVTELSHLRDDAAVQQAESDLTHLPEILRLHDLSRDPGAGDAAAFERRSRENLRHRCLHHHVFDTALALALADEAGWQIAQLAWRSPYHIILVLKRPAGARGPDNREFLAPQARWRARSLFNADRVHMAAAASVAR